MVESGKNIFYYLLVAVYSPFSFINHSKNLSLNLQVWLYNIGLGSLVYTVEKECDGSGEDPTCSRYAFSSSATLVSIKFSCFSVA